MTLSTPADSPTDLYQFKDDVETPAILVNLDIMDENMRRYADFATEHGVRLRSHAKTHKTPDLARYQDCHSHGGGVVCQTLSEAGVMAQSGVDNIYLTYMVVGESKLDRLT